MVRVDQVNAASSVLTRVAVALLNLDVTDGACISWVAVTGVGSNTIDTDAMVTRFWYTIVDVLLAELTSETYGRDYS